MDEMAAMPKIKFNCANAWWSASMESGLVVYRLYSLRISGRWTIGYSGAHSWKKMFNSLSDTRRGRMLDGVISSCRRAFNDGAQSRASANAVVGDLPLLSSRTENESIDQTC